MSETETVRISEIPVTDGVLRGWMQALIGYVRSGQPDLTNRQMALMMVVYLTPGPHTVRGLAHVLGVSKPVITRALNTLGTLGYLRRVRDEADRRNVFVAHTSTGRDFLERFERNIEQQEGGSRRPQRERALLFQHG
jgi:DNA-binding MarR family transcriptional regulator